MGLVSCIGQQDRFSIKGQFTGLQDAELYFWTPEGGHGKLDTVTVRQGKFAFEMPQATPSWYTMMFQNLSEQVIFAEPGLTVNVEADATRLRDMKIVGGEANKLMSMFREEIAGESQISLISEKAKAFILKHPESIVSIYLLQKYFVQQGSTNLQEISQILDVLLQAQPEASQLMSIKRTLDAQEKVKVGMKAPDFMLRDIQGSLQDLLHYKDSTLLLCFWANWQNDSKEAMRSLRRVKREEWSRKVSIVSVSLDLAKVSWRTALRVDSIPGHHICDLHAWENSAVKAYGISELPTFVLIDTDNKIVARENDLAKITEMINK